MSQISIIIPALNEEEPIGNVVREVLATELPGEVIVVDNGSTDRTAERAASAKVKPAGPLRAIRSSAASISASRRLPW